MRKISKFFKDLKDKYLTEELKNLEVKIVAQKKDDKFIILFIRIGYTKDSISESAEINYSLEKCSIIVKDIVSEMDFDNKIQNTPNGYRYDLDGIDLTFFKEPVISTNDEEWKEKLNTNHHKYYKLKDINEVLLVFRNSLYDLGEISDDGPINTNDDSIFEKTRFYDLSAEFKKSLFVWKWNLLSGEDLFDLFFKNNEHHLPQLLFVLPIPSFQIEFKTSKVENNIKININWSLSDKLLDKIEFKYSKGDEATNITDSEVQFEINEDYQGILDFVIFWKGSNDFLPLDTRFYLKSYELFSNTEDKEKVQQIREKIEDLLHSLDNDSSVEDRIKLFYDLSENYRLLKIWSDFFNSIDLNKEIKEAESNQIQNYQKYVRTLEEKYNRGNIDFQCYLTLNNLLFSQYEDKIDILIQRYHQDIGPHTVIFGETDILEINIMILNLNKALSNITNQIEGAYRNEEKYELINLFEILGDLYIHLVLLKIIAPGPDFKFFDSYFELNYALESYQKSLDYLQERSIPGIGRMSIRVSSYMKIFNKFIILDGLNDKIEYIQKFSNRKDSSVSIHRQESYQQLSRRIPSEENKEISSTMKTFITPEANHILKKIENKYEKMNKSYSDLANFVAQAPNPELQTGLAIILERTCLRTTDEVANDLAKIIRNNVDSLENVYLILFDDVKMKSNELWNNLINRELGKKLKYINLDNIEGIIQSLNPEKKYFFLFLDNIIGSGGDFVKNFNANLAKLSNESTTSLDTLVELKQQSSNVFFKIVVAFGSDHSKDYISSNIKLFNYDDFWYSHTVNEEEKAFNLVNCPNKEMQENLIEYLKEKHPNTYRGWKNCEFLVITQDSKPNNTIGCLIYSNKNWTALFPRML